MPNKKILVVDDEKEYVELVRNILSIHGYEVCVAYDGQEAIKAIEKEAPDMAILDINMPKMSGYDVCNWLSINEKYKNMPFIMVTACDKVEDVKAGISHGAISYLVKPFNQTTLLSLVESLLNQAPF